MKESDIKLIFKDLCCRLPYGVRGERTWTAPVSGSPEKGIYVFDTFDIKVLTTGCYDCGEYGFREVRNYSFKPYLFPLLSMTEEQKDELINKGLAHYYSLGEHDKIIIFHEGWELIDWLNSNHFDYRELIEKGLAIDATNLNIY